MADDAENDDQWLYGDNLDTEHVDQPPPGEEPPSQSPPPTNDVSENHKDDQEATTPMNLNNDLADYPPGEEPPVNHEESSTEPPNDKSTEETDDKEEDEEEKQNGEGSDKEDYDEDSDDDVNVVIGDFKTTPAAYSSLNIKRGGLLTSTTKGDKPQAQTGKFTIDEFEQGGFINGIPVSEFNLDSLEDKPWRKPGADITDYFNYGFNEDTWRAYCERQKRMRVNESGSGLLPLNSIGMPRPSGISIMNDNSGNLLAATGLPLTKMMQPKENVIQVMTADRREYSRKPPSFPDMTIPPPAFEEFVPEMNFNPEPEPFYGGYEPTQDVQWGTEPNPAWQPHEIKTLTGASSRPGMVPPMGMPTSAPRLSPVVPSSGSPGERSPPLRRSRSRERESSRRDRDRERSHRREQRSRSRSRRHKSRSRSQSRSHRSHRKKKSRRHDDSE